MSSESGQRLPMEELKRRNAPQSMIPQNCPSKEEWQELLHRLDELERHTAAQTALLREASSRRKPYPTQAQMEALTRDVAQMRAELKQAGKKRELSISPPSLRTALSVSIWLALILLATMVGMVVLQTIWSGLAALWSVIKLLIP
mgnify:CR=1 FL=1